MIMGGSEIAKTHIPVMLSEILHTFHTIPTGNFMDATLGDGGHAESLLEAHEHTMLIGFDRDEQAIERAEQRLARFANRCTFINASFAEVGKELDNLGISELSGALFDLGVSSNQLEDPARGFSYRNEGSLDMRMDQRQPLTANEIINKWSEKEIADILYEYGDERNSRKIAQAIVQYRTKNRGIENREIKTTLELATIISKVNFSKRTHPARRSFQALRVYVNRELEQIEPALIEVKNRLMVGGRIVVMSYHSGEDKIAKSLFREWEAKSPEIHPLHRRVKKPTADEVSKNPKARSARLRSAEKVQKSTLQQDINHHNAEELIS